jgi:hypothetical protein
MAAHRNDPWLRTADAVQKLLPFSRQAITEASKHIQQRELLGYVLFTIDAPSDGFLFEQDIPEFDWVDTVARELDVSIARFSNFHLTSSGQLGAVVHYILVDTSVFSGLEYQQIISGSATSDAFDPLKRYLDSQSASNS